jgi:hypothetical protein
MKPSHSTWTLIALVALVPAFTAQAPILHYSFSEGGSPATTENTGTLLPGPSPLIGHTLTGVNQNRTNALDAQGSARIEVPREPH